MHYRSSFPTVHARLRPKLFLTRIIQLKNWAIHIPTMTVSFAMYRIFVCFSSDISHTPLTNKIFTFILELLDFVSIEVYGINKA